MDNLEFLAKYNPDPRDLMKACPFDQQRNLNGNLTEEIFFDHLFYEDSAYAANEEKLDDMLWGELPHKIVVIHGYSGTGKSTFVRFLRHRTKKNKSAEFKIIDLHALAQPTADLRSNKLRALSQAALDQALAQSDLTNEQRVSIRQDYLNQLGTNEHGITRDFAAVRALKTILTELGWQKTLETLAFIRRNRRYFAQYLSEKVLNIILNNEVGDEDSALNVLNQSNYDDTMIIYFTRVFRNMESKDRIVFIFDNLDVLGDEYLTSNFLNGFGDVLLSLTRLSQTQELFGDKHLDFGRQVRFVLVLREANKALANQHIIDSFGHEQLIDFHQIHREVDVGFIFNKRLELISKVCRRQGQTDMSPTVSALVESLRQYVNENYFRQCIRPMFNHDLKKLVEVLLSLPLNPMPQGSDGKNIVRYGVIGRFVFSIAVRLQKVKFYKDWYAEKFGNAVEGEIVEKRIILTVLVNLCGGEVEHGETYIPEKYVSLLDIIIAMENLVSDETIIKILVEAFSCHSTEWAGLVTFKDKDARSISSFKQELDNLRDARKLCAKKGTTNLRDPQIRPLLTEVEAVMVRANPACYAFLRYFIIHFEFISSKFGGETPLFGTPIDRKNCLDQYEFVALIDRVYRVLKNQKRMMEVYCKENFFTIDEIDASSFRSSVFCFGSGLSGSYSRNPNHHHPIRVISQCIDYIDRYRVYSLRDATSSDKREINRILVSKVEKFVRLLEESLDPDGKIFAKEFTQKIKKIKDNNYVDFSTNINLFSNRVYRSK